MVRTTTVIAGFVFGLSAASLACDKSLQDAIGVDEGAQRDGEADATDAADAVSGASAGAVCTGGTGRVIVVAPSGGDARTVQAGLDAARAGDTVLVRSGTYAESVSFPRSGSAEAGCITLKGEAGATIEGTRGGSIGIAIRDRSYVAVIGMTVRGFRGGDTPTGIDVRGSAHHVEVRNNVVERIESSANAHGIAFYGTSSTPMSDLVIDGNEIRDCKLGESESMVLNGNVTRFVVSHNKVHDNDNIGIDFIGFEGQGPAGQDQARDGRCVDNVVYNITSRNNPAYHGESAADGIYVDGGRNIVIERNRVWNADIGIEVASEHGGKTTSDIVVRNNFVAGSVQGNVMIGGYDADRGNARNITVVHNTLYRGGAGEVVLQHNASNVNIRNNILYAKANAAYASSTGANNTSVVVDNNVYFGASRSSAGTWRDAHARFTDPMLVGAPSDLHLAEGSPAIDAATALGELAGGLDVDGAPRISGATTDVGADER